VEFSRFRLSEYAISSVKNNRQFLAEDYSQVFVLRSKHFCIPSRVELIDARLFVASKAPFRCWENSLRLSTVLLTPKCIQDISASSGSNATAAAAAAAAGGDDDDDDDDGDMASLLLFSHVNVTSFSYTNDAAYMAYIDSLL